MMESARLLLEQHGYTLLGPVGSGGFSSCFMVFSSKYNIQFVAKLTEKGTSKDLHRNIVFHNELNSLKELEHPNVIHLFDFFSDDQYNVMIIEYCPYGSLHDHVEKNGTLSGNQIIKVTKPIIESLNYCHKAMIAHHDIKPANILIDSNHRVKLADFGISQKYDCCLSKNYSSSPYCTPPEICLKEVYNPFKADVWSFGVTLYYLVTAEYPFTGSDKQTIYKHIINGDLFIPCSVPSVITKIIRACLNLKPSKRPSFEELLQHPIYKESDSCLIRSSSTEVYPEIIVPFRRIAKNAKLCNLKPAGRSKIYSRSERRSLLIC